MFTKSSQLFWVLSLYWRNMIYYYKISKISTTFLSKRFVLFSFFCVFEKIIFMLSNPPLWWRKFKPSIFFLNLKFNWQYQFHLFLKTFVQFSNYLNHNFLHLSEKKGDCFCVHYLKIPLTSRTLANILLLWSFTEKVVFLN